MNKYTNFLLSIIIVLLLINIAFTRTIFLRQSGHEHAVMTQVDKLDSEVARAWGDKVATMYNQQNHQALYALFNEQAKVKISHQQLESQLKKLFELFGEIEESAFVSANKIGEKNERMYYQLLFNIRVKEASKRQAKLTISVIKKDNMFSLYGVSIKALQSLD